MSHCCCIVILKRFLVLYKQSQNSKRFAVKTNKSTTNKWPIQNKQYLQLYFIVLAYYYNHYRRYIIIIEVEFFCCIGCILHSIIIFDVNFSIQHPHILKRKPLIARLTNKRTRFLKYWMLKARYQLGLQTPHVVSDMLDGSQGLTRSFSAQYLLSK